MNTILKTLLLYVTLTIPTYADTVMVWVCDQNGCHPTWIVTQDNSTYGDY